MSTPGALADERTVEAYLRRLPPVLERWLDERGLSSGPVELSPIGGGTQNLLLRVRRGDERYVLRRPALAADDRDGTAMRREQQVLTALAGTPVPHPRLLGWCEDPHVIGSSFLLMTDVEGFCPRFGVPPDYAAHPASAHRMGLGVVDAIAELALLDPAEIGLADLGVPGWAERQVRRWSRQLDGYRQIDGRDGPRLAGSEPVARWLESHRPERTRLGVVHGDYHLANVIVRHDEPTVAAIVDWELATIGDPLLDLGHLLVTWPKGGAGPPELARLPLPEPDELAHRYLQRTRRDPADLHWFQVLAGYRLAIILEGTHARSRAGRAPAEVGQRLHALAQTLMTAAGDTAQNDH